MLIVMLKERRYYPNLRFTALCAVLCMLMCTAAVVLVNFTVAQAQVNWTAMPPYNLLWPLWSSVQSPANTAGTPTPIITSLTRNTVLPVQPCIAWDPYFAPPGVWSMGEVPPWLFYNTPTGLVFFDTVYGINPWPPAKYVNPTTGAPNPISLLAGYSLLATTPALLPVNKAEYLVSLANLSYLIGYGNSLGVSPSSLLTAAQLFGLPPV